MKTLSVRQPWAYLICSGIKDVENRSRRTNYQGKVLIHSPAKGDPRGDKCFLLEQVKYIARYGKEFAVHNFLHSAIIGSVEIIDCVQNHSSIWAAAGYWHWILENPVLFDKPILNVPGRLGLWDFDMRTIK